MIEVSLKEDHVLLNDVDNNYNNYNALQDFLIYASYTKLYRATIKVTLLKLINMGFKFHDLFKCV